jgi:hypothetical protein
MVLMVGAACQRAPPDERPRVVTAQCHKLFQCTPSNSSYATEAACVTGQPQALRCDTWWVPDTCPFDRKTFDSCLADYDGV